MSNLLDGQYLVWDGSVFRIVGCIEPGMYLVMMVAPTGTEWARKVVPLAEIAEGMLAESKAEALAIAEVLRKHSEKEFHRYGQAKVPGVCDA